MSKKFLTILLSVLLPVFLVGAVVYAVTSVGDDISVADDLDLVGTDLQGTTGTLNISKSGTITTVKGTLNVDEAVTLDSTIAVTGTSTLATTTATKLTVSGATVLDGGLTMDTNKFTVADTSGNTAIAGTLGVTGTSTLATTTIGSSGTAITKHLSVASTSLTIASIAATTCLDVSVTVTGAAVGDTCVIGPPDDIESNLSVSCFISATDTVKIRLCNPTNAAINPADDNSWRIDVWHH